MDEKELVKREIYEAVAFFIERQKLVAQAMLDLGLDLNLVDKWGPMAWGSMDWILDNDTESSSAKIINSCYAEETSGKETG